MNANSASCNPDHRVDMDYLKDKLRWSFEYHLDEYAQRLKEIGGLGVGGTELEYVPFKGVDRIDSAQKQKQHALSLSLSKLWDEASWSYVQGHFCACILLTAGAIERALKLELEKQNVGSKSITLGECIKQCRTYSILPTDDDHEVVRAAKFVNERRNDVIHANVELDRAGELLAGTAPEHEVVSLSSMPEQIRKCVVTENGERKFLPLEEEANARIVYEYKASAKATREDANKLLKYLYDNVQPVGSFIELHGSDEMEKPNNSIHSECKERPPLSLVLLPKLVSYLFKKAQVRISPLRRVLRHWTSR